MGCLFVVYFSKDVKALDTLDFWVGTFLIFILATIQIIIFGWSMGLEKGYAEAHQGAIFHIPVFFKVIMKYICPLFLLTIFVLWVLVNLVGLDFATGQSNVPTYVTDLFGENKSVVAWLSIAIIIFVAIFFAIIVSRVSRYRIDANDVTGGVK
jgi:SNF family Na+-dependent transporter